MAILARNAQMRNIIFAGFIIITATNCIFVWKGHFCFRHESTKGTFQDYTGLQRHITVKYAIRPFHKEKTTEIVSMVMGITTNGMKLKPLDILQGPNKTKFPFLNLVTSFCAYSSPGFLYSFYVAYDFNDDCFGNDICLQQFSASFADIISKQCQHLGSIHIHLIKCNYTGKPAWAQNDAAMRAYLEGSDYIFRLNDDIVFKTPNWTSNLVGVLRQMTPPYVGVVAPSVGRDDIFIVDFVHKTHVDIFGYYYPRELPDWYCDGWITYVYGKGNSRRVKSVRLAHSQSFGTRYKPTTYFGKGLEGKNYRNILIKRDNNTLQRFKIQMKLNAIDPQGTSHQRQNTIVFLFNITNQTEIIPLIRNVQITKVFLTNWKTEVFIIGHENNDDLISNEYGHSFKLNCTSYVHSELLLQANMANYSYEKGHHVCYEQDSNGLFLQHVINKLIDLEASVYYTQNISKFFKDEQKDFVFVWSSNEVVNIDNFNFLRAGIH